MSFNYPVFFNLNGKKCLVVGGGRVAERKISKLLDSGAVVSVIAKKTSSEIEKLANHKKIYLIKKEYSKESVDNFFLVFAATDNKILNEQIANECDLLNIPVNVVDNVKKCTFILPSMFSKDDILIAVSTNGKSPAVSKLIKKIFDSNLGDLVEKVYEFKSDIKKNITDQSKRASLINEIISRENSKWL